VKKILFALLVVFFLVPTGITSASGKGLVSLWDIKVSSNQTIGNLWFSMPSYQYTCKSGTIKFPNGETYNKVVFWPNFYWLDTLVSKDTECVLTNTAKGRALVQKWTSEPLLYRHLSSNFYDGHLDLIEALQVRSFRIEASKLVCKANVLALYTNWYDQATDTVVEMKPRYQKALFAPYTSSWSPHQFYASRDLTCTTDVVTINKWKRNPYWTWVSLPKLP